MPDRRAQILAITLGGGAIVGCAVAGFNAADGNASAIWPALGFVGGCLAAGCYAALSKINSSGRAAPTIEVNAVIEDKGSLPLPLRPLSILIELIVVAIIIIWLRTPPDLVETSCVVNDGINGTCTFRPKYIGSAGACVQVSMVAPGASSDVTRVLASSWGICSGELRIGKAREVAFSLNKFISDEDCQGECTLEVTFVE